MEVSATTQPAASTQQQHEQHVMAGPAASTSSNPHEPDMPASAPPLDMKEDPAVSEPTASQQQEVDRSSMFSDASTAANDARRARREAEDDADRKLIEAVCKASLLEFTEQQRALSEYERNLKANDMERENGTMRLDHERSDAERRKREAMQRVIDSKGHAKAMSEKALLTTRMYEEKNRERLEKLSALELMEQQRIRDEELRMVQSRKDEAMRKREEAQHRVALAEQRAADARRKVIDAAKVVRSTSRKQIELDLTNEEAQRQREAEFKLSELEREKQAARERKEAAAARLEEAKRRAEEMRRKAIEAASVVRATSRKQIEHDLTEEEQRRQREAQFKLDELEREKMGARERKEAAAQRAAEAQRRAEEMRRKAIEAASAVRSTSRKQIELDLQEEEAQRQREAEFKLTELGREKEYAREQTTAAAQRAEEARRRAEELQTRAHNATHSLNSAKSGSLV
ncbi:TPA: hypothetical protein N0F65_011056 [Lagenidium giganteum]|uniref:Uncharacterized protein n=1 Tax=Lagenidium giganteum TaxID=4803 RepID=A0AAV2ZC00_9STRA|nr:TPA: hypothetical protein N0F65_011056 [Lagenidium giganteum]